MQNKKRKAVFEVIDFFLNIPEALIKGFERNQFYNIINGNFVEQKLTCDNISHLISNMKRSGYIKVEKTDTRESIRFTDKARLAVVDKIAERSTVDSIHRFVSFDIPERLRLNRDQFRRTIKRLGFKQIQKSLWVCHKDIGDMVELAAREYKVLDYVVYVVSENTNIESVLSDLFSKDLTVKSK